MMHNHAHVANGLVHLRGEDLATKAEGTAGFWIDLPALLHDGIHAVRTANWLWQPLAGLEQ